MSEPREVLVVMERRAYVGDTVIAVCLGEDAAKRVAERHHTSGISGVDYGHLIWEFVGDGWIAESSTRPMETAYLFGPYDLISDPRHYDGP